MKNIASSIPTSHTFTSRQCASAKALGAKAYRTMGLSTYLGEAGKQQNIFDVLAPLCGAERVKACSSVNFPTGYMYALQGVRDAAVAAKATEKEILPIDIEMSAVRYLHGVNRGTSPVAYPLACHLAKAYGYADERVLNGWNAPLWVGELRMAMNREAKEEINRIWKVEQAKHDIAVTLRVNVAAEVVALRSEVVGM